MTPDKRIIFAGAVCVGLVGFLALRTPLHHASVSVASDNDSALPIPAPVSGKIIDLIVVHEGEGNLRSQWPEGSNLPAGINFQVAKLDFPAHVVSADVIQAITPECDARGVRQATCPTLISAQFGSDSSTNRVFSIRACRIGHQTAVTVSGTADPNLTCVADLDIASASE